MKRGGDISVEFPGLTLIHHNQPERTTPWHAHDDEHQLILVLQGRVELDVDPGPTLVAPAGRTVLIPAGCAHAFRSEETHQGERLVALMKASEWSEAGVLEPRLGVHVTQSLVREALFFLLLHPRTPHVKPFTQAVIVAIVEAIRRAGPMPMAAATPRAAALALAESGGPVEPDRLADHLVARAGDERMKRAIRFLADHACDDVPLARLAKASGLSERNLSRLFLQECGLSPKQLQTRFRIARACTLLSGGRTTVTTVALEVGYGGLSNFFRAFRAVTGMAPSEWQESKGALAGNETPSAARTR